jgi:hypothetical protein
MPLNQRWAVWVPMESVSCGLGDSQVLSELGKGDKRTKAKLGDPTGQRLQQIKKLSILQTRHCMAPS